MLRRGGMNLLPTRVKASPVAVRVVPFILFLFLTAAQSWAGGAGQFWIYLLKTALGGWMIWEVRSFVPEMQWRWSLAAIGGGVAGFAVWVGLEHFLRGIGVNPAFAVIKSSGPAWNPKEFFGSHAPMAWFFIGVRILGSSVVVPPLEE